MINDNKPLPKWLSEVAELCNSMNAEEKESTINAINTVLGSQIVSNSFNENEQKELYNASRELFRDTMVKRGKNNCAFLSVQLLDAMQKEMGEKFPIQLNNYLEKHWQISIEQDQNFVNGFMGTFENNKPKNQIPAANTKVHDIEKQEPKHGIE